MKRAATIGLTMGVVASSLLSALPMQAADPITSVVRGMGSVVSGTVDAAGNIIDASGKVVGRVVEGSVGATGTVVDTAGSVVGTTGQLADTGVVAGRTLTFGTVTDVLGMSLDNRRADIDRMIANAVISGKLTSAQAAELRLDLDRLARAEAEARISSGSMTFDEAMVIARDLDTLSNRVATTIAVTPLTPLVVLDGTSKTPRMVVTTVRRAGTPLSTLGDIVAGTVDASGNIIDTSGQVVGKVMTTTTRTVGGVADTAITTTGTVADTAIGTVVGTTAFGVRSLADMLSARRAELDRVIFQHHASGKLTSEQAAALRGDLDIVARKEVELLGSDGVITFDEATVIARSLDDVNNNVGKMVGANLVPLLITDASGTTRLSVNTYRVTTPGGGIVQKTTTTTTTTTAPAGIVSTTTPGTLMITSTPSNTPTVWWSVLDSRRSEMERAIAHALFQGTISASQAAELRSDLYRITRTLWTAQGNVSAFTSDQALLIANDLDTLSNRVVTATKITAMPRLVADVSGTRRLVLDNFGNIVEVSAVTPTVYVSTLDTRRAQLEAGIAAALAAGKLTDAQATEFRNWLDRINESQRTVVTTGGVTYIKALPIATEMDLLANRLSTFMNAPLTPLVVGSRFMLTGNQVVVVDDVNVRKADIEARINREVLVGRLTIKQGDDLRGELSAVSTNEAGMRADGSLTTDELMSLLSALDRVDESLNRNIASSRGRTQSVLIVPSSF